MSCTRRIEAPLSCALVFYSPRGFRHVQRLPNIVLHLSTIVAYVIYEKRIDSTDLRQKPHFAHFRTSAHCCAFLPFCCALGPTLFRSYTDVIDKQISINKPPDEGALMTSWIYNVQHSHSHELRRRPRHNCFSPVPYKWS